MTLSNPAQHVKSPLTTHTWVENLLSEDSAHPPFETFSRRALHKGELLSTPNAAKNQVFIVQDGRLRVYLTDSNRELTLCFLDPGEIYTTHTPTYVEAAISSTILVTDTAKFSQHLAHNAAITPIMMRVLGRILSNSVDLIADLAFREVPQRLARFILGRIERVGQHTALGWQIHLELSTEDIASLLGTTRQTVSSLINQWERQGIISRTGRRILVIPHLSALKEIAAQ